jgi:hypothetical protein
MILNPFRLLSPLFLVMERLALLIAFFINMFTLHILARQAVISGELIKMNAIMRLQLRKR